MDIRLRDLKPTKYKGTKAEFKEELKRLQYRMLSLQQTLRKEDIGLIIAFEGMDAAGKGGAIKRLTQRMDPRGFNVHPIAAPQPHELRYLYLHRFFRKLPQHGQIAIFDRSWYGRVLVERIEHFATDAEWKRAYEEICAFEKMLTDEKYIIVKHWLHVSDREQLKRFEERQSDPYKTWKLTDEDWRNRNKRDEYIEAAEEMVAKTDAKKAPWFLTHGDDKLYARLAVLQKTIDEIEKQLTKRGFSIADTPAESMRSEADVAYGEKDAGGAADEAH